MGMISVNPVRRSQKIRKCWHCGRSVHETVGNSGLCKKCIKDARLMSEQKEGK